jgi:CubicO group peptidase (beta-lactamase class C family)/D-alanyl-D-alanine dipeptidase
LTLQPFLKTVHLKTRGAAVACVLSACVWARLDAQQTVAPQGSVAQIAAVIEPFIQHEMSQKGIPAVSIALVDGQRIVWARGFGYANPTDSIAASAETIYRVGSVSKLFTDIGVMQQVEKGQLDLDAPVVKYLPDFHPRNPFGKPITLRQLMSHMSGLTREPPVGNYFDTTGASLAETVRSLNNTTLVYTPETHTKYSNAGIATVGYVLERTQGQSFYPYLKHAVLEPMGLTNSAFEPLPELRSKLAKAYMWSYDGKFWEAPTFQLGMGPCGSMYTSVLDLGRFMGVLFNGGEAANGRVLRRETLEQMWTPQYAKPGQKSGFGLGFALSRMNGHRVIGHDGAIYGFATALLALPDDRLGVVVVATLDGANTTADRIADAALRALLAQRENRAVTQPDTTRELEAGVARRLAGRYVKGRSGIDLYNRAGKLFMMPMDGGMRAELRAQGDYMISDDRLGYGIIVRPLDDRRILVGVDTLARVTVPKPPPAPPEFASVIGEYGWPHNTLYILEKDGKLNALIEWFFQYPLARVSRDVYKFPNSGLYDGQEIVFKRDARGVAHEAVAATVPFKRRPLPGDNNAVAFKIPLQRSVDELRREALAASPPPQSPDLLKPDLVELRALDPTIKYDMRYATTNNFMSTVFYLSAHAFMQRPAAEAVVRANRKLHKLGYGLLIHDSYRPWYVTKMFWEATPPAQRIFVADPSQGSRHNRGAAVDLTLYDLKTGRPARMTGGYDEFSDRSFPDYPGGTSPQRWQRELLRTTMEDEGFQVYDFEWWHFDYNQWRRYPVLNLTFEQLQKQ